MNWQLAEQLRADTLSAGHPEGLVRLPGRKPPSPPKWYIVVMITLTVLAFLLGRLT